MKGHRQENSLPDLPLDVPVSTRVLTVILGVLQALTFLSIDLYLPAFPHMARELGVEMGQIQWSLSIFLLGIAVGQVLWGPLVDHFGRKKPLLTGLLLFAVGAVMCALSGDLSTLLIGRFLQALGGAALPVASIAMVRDVWKGKEAAVRFSMHMLVSGVAPIVAPPLGGLFLTHFPWQGVFWGLALLGGVLYLLVSMLPETSPTEGRASLEFRGTLQGYWSHLQNRPFVLYLLTGALIAAVMFAYITGSSLVFIEVLGVTPGLYGTLFGLIALGFVLGAQLNRFLLRRFSLVQLARSAVLLNLLTTLLLVLLALTDVHALWAYTVLFFGMAFSCGSARPNLPSLGFEHIKVRLGSAAALQGILQYVLGGLTGGLVGLVSHGGVLPVVLVMAGSSVLALMVGWRAEKARTESQPH